MTCNLVLVSSFFFLPLVLVIGSSFWLIQELHVQFLAELSSLV